MTPSHLDQALKMIDAGRNEEAEQILLDMNDALPDNPMVLYGLGLVNRNFYRLELARDYLKRVIKLAPKNAEPHAAMAEVLNTMTLHEDALAAARKAVALAPKSDLNHLTLADTYQYLRKPVVARQAYLQALKLNPDNSETHVQLARLDKHLGDREAVVEHLTKALELNPRDPLALVEAADDSGLAADDALLQKIVDEIEAPDTPASAEDKANLSLAAGKLFDKKGELDKAFEYYTRHRSGLYPRYDIEQRKYEILRMKEVFNKDFFDQRRDFGLPSEKPVFVLGMPRSGTTLVEQIIARHPKAAGMGENTFFRLQQKELEQPLQSPGNPGFMATPEPARAPVDRLAERILAEDTKYFKRLGRKYLTDLDKVDRKALRVVDKMPHNFEVLWLIAVVFPNARIIHLQREPADTCLSIFTTPLKRSHNYNLDLATLGAYYSLYADLMDHWNEILPVEIRNQSYEDLINSQETETRALIDFCGLSWEPACLDFQSGNELVTTFSSRQVRQPVYNSSIGRWKKYREYLGPLLEQLGQHAPK